MSPKINSNPTRLMSGAAGTMSLMLPIGMNINGTPAPQTVYNTLFAALEYHLLGHVVRRHLKHQVEMLAGRR